MSDLRLRSHAFGWQAATGIVGLMCVLVLTGCTPRRFSLTSDPAGAKSLSLRVLAMADAVRIAPSSGVAFRAVGTCRGQAPTLEMDGSGTGDAAGLLFGIPSHEGDDDPPPSDGIDGTPTRFELGPKLDWSVDLAVPRAHRIDIDARRLRVHDLNVRAIPGARTSVRLSALCLQASRSWPGEEWASLRVSMSAASSLTVEIPSDVSVLCQTTGDYRPLGPGWRHVESGPHDLLGAWVLPGDPHRWLIIEPDGMSAIMGHRGQPLPLPLTVARS